MGAFAFQTITRDRQEAAKELRGSQKPSFCLASRVLISIDGPDQPLFDLPPQHLPMGPRNPFHFSPGLLVPAWAVMWSIFPSYAWPYSLFLCPWQLNRLPGLTSHLAGNHWTGTDCHHQEWYWPTNQLLIWTLDLFCHHKLAWWSGLSVEPKSIPGPACSL